MSRVRTIVATEILLVVGLLLFVAAAWAVEQVYGLDGPIQLGPLSAILLSAVPGMLWLGYFYLQDRHEPEPKHYVFGVYLLGVFFAGPVAGFLVNLSTPDSQSLRSLAKLSADRAVSALLITGLAQELVKYVTVRYSVYLSSEFDEPMDGIIYMTAAGIGFATTENYRYLQGLDGSVFLSTGAANAVVTTVAHACFAGVLGYALGRAKFTSKSPLRRSVGLCAGLLVAAVLNGQFALIEGAVKSTGLQIQPWRSLAYAAGFAAVVFFLTSLLMQRHLAASPHAPAAPEATP